MTEPVKNAVERLMLNRDFHIFLGHLLTKGYFFKELDPIKHVKEVSVQQFLIGIQGDLGMFTTAPDFQLRYVEALSKNV